MVLKVTPAELDVANTVAVWTEVFIYGIYTSLFANTMIILWNKRLSRAKQKHGARMFLWTTVLMYVLVSLHAALSLFRYIDAYVLVENPAMRGVELFNFERWHTILSYAYFFVLTWIADSLVIYRCYYVWNRNFWVILLPVLMLVAFIALGLYTVTELNLKHPAGVAPMDSVPTGVLQTMYPLVVAQNILTTGLMGFKIWQQHRLSMSYGIVDRNSPLSLMRILRILIESALVYTLQIITYMILFFEKSPWQVVVQNMIVPSLGIVFVLISLRVHYAKTSSDGGDDTSLPPWLGNTTSSPGFTDHRSHRSQPTVDVVSLPVAGENYHEPNAAIPLEPYATWVPPGKIKNDGHDL